MAAFFAIMIWMEGKSDISDQRVAVIDRSGIVFQELAVRAEERNAEIAAAAENGRPSAPRYLLEAREPPEKKRRIWMHCFWIFLFKRRSLAGRRQVFAFVS